MAGRVSWVGIAALLLMLGAGAPGCNLFSSSRVAHGQRYQSEDSRYDPYFDAVHQQQVAAAAWPDERKAARRPLLNVLSLTPSANDDTIVSATRTRAKKLAGGGGKLEVATAHVTPVGAGDPPLFAAVEEGVRLELDRARKLRAVADKLEEMAKQGEELKKTADRDYENRGAEKADEKKSDKRNEIRRELGGAIGALRDLGHDANKDARAAQDFIEDLGEAIEAKDAPPRRRGDRESKPLPPPAPAKVEAPKDDEPKKEEPKPAKPSKPEPRKKPADKPAEKPKPPPDEVFNP